MEIDVNEVAKATPSELIRMALKQLIFYKYDGRVPSEHLLNDIEGYHQILESDEPDKNAKTFLDYKHDASSKYEDNLKVIQAMKEQGEWL